MNMFQVIITKETVFKMSRVLQYIFAALKNGSVILYCIEYA